MSIVMGIDLGTTTITALALNAHSGDILAKVTAPNQAEITSAGDRERGRSEWDVLRLAQTACQCLRQAAEMMGASWSRLAGLGLTGQQHSLVLVDQALKPLIPLINWQDRRAMEPDPETGTTLLHRALELAGDQAPLRTGCRLAAGFMSLSLLWMKEHGTLPSSGTACFLTDYFAALLTGQTPVTDPTCAGSSGFYDVRSGQWDRDLLTAFQLPPSLFPEVRPSGALLGKLVPEMAEATGLPAGLPILVGVGDNQASFLGTVGDPQETVLVNVGTGAQVSAFSARFLFTPQLETRPYPGGGFLLVCPGLCGGRTYALLERFFRQVGEIIFGVTRPEPLYSILNRLAASAPAGVDGLRCDPFFTGTRYLPELRASWAGMSPENFNPAHMTRALLEGMARAFAASHETIAGLTGIRSSRLVGAGNGIRENPVLAQLIAEKFCLPLTIPRHREEAAFGAALLASVGAGIHWDLASAGNLIRYLRSFDDQNQ
jgi:sugar (pentulose or hexulose) kinase